MHNACLKGGFHDSGQDVHESKYVFRPCTLQLVCRQAYLIALLMNQSGARRLLGYEI